MKALSLTQPWATLVAIGAKKIETRSWFTGYRGEIGIHASKGFPRDCRELCGEEPFYTFLQRLPGMKFRTPPPEHWYYIARHYYREGLPLGAIVAVAEIHACLSTDVFVAHNVTVPLSALEQQFGDFSEGRYGWVLGNVRALPVPIPCKGALGLWTVPSDVERLIRTAVAA